MGRIRVEIDDRLLAEAMRRYRLKSKHAALDLALRRLLGAPLSRADVLGIEGSGWEGDVLEIRRSRFTAR